jgi:single-strand DNA-binding protein
MFSQTILIGRLGKDPEGREVGSTQVANLNIATDYSFKNRDGEWTKKTEWTQVKIWGAQAKSVTQYLKKGSLVAVVGRPETETYEKNGETKYVTKVVADRVIFLDSKSASSPDYGNEGAAVAVAKASRPVTKADPISDEDVPF